VVGKPLGIAASAWLLLRLRLARLPEGVGLRHIVGGGLLAGIGFTVATFIAEQALAPELLPQAKLGILLASIIAAVLGALWLLACSRDEQKDAIQPAGGKLGP
jgi:NhaA family Na+:H+ antiporter